MIATGKPAQLAGHLGRALDNGVQPREASSVLAHLAIYSGWPTAVSALDVYEQVYTARKVDTAGLRDATPRLPASASDASRAQAMTEQLGAIAPKFVQGTYDVVFDDLWRRADLTVRDRSLVTIAAPAAMGDDDQLDVYLRRAIAGGLTRAQITEALTHLGFYAGWAKATRDHNSSYDAWQMTRAADLEQSTYESKDKPEMAQERRSRMGHRRFLGPAGSLAAASLLGGANSPAAAQTTGSRSNAAAQVGGRRQLGPLDVSSVGLGVQNISRTYQTTVPHRPEMINIIRTAFDRGVTFYDVAEAYGPHEVERILGEAVAPFRDKVVSASKFRLEHRSRDRRAAPGAAQSAQLHQSSC